MYDRSIAMYDEAHPPEVLDRAFKKGPLNKCKFLTSAHFHSYYMQMLTIRNLGAKSVLEIGPGEYFAANYMRSLGIQYDTMDIVRECEPTIVGKLEDLDASLYESGYDVVCAFQMLEHSPYDMFTQNLSKMATMSKKYIFISLPYSCFGIKLSVNLSLGQNKRKVKDLSLYLPLNKKNRKYRDEYVKEFPWAVHYWEIGRRGFPLKRVRSDIKSVGLNIIDEFHSENPYHYFILAEKL